MERVSSSPLLEKSARLRAFLRFICEMELAGRRSEINEQQVGVGVFGRAQAYSPGEDSIVRSQARLLRQRLEEYFRTIGRHEPIRITIPKGSYVPIFEPNPEVAPEKLSAPQLALAPELSSSAPVTRVGANWFLATAVVAVVIAATAGSLMWREKNLTPPDPYTQFWNTVFEPQRGQVIVPADSTLILIEEITGQPVSLENYLNRDYLKKSFTTVGLSSAELAVSNYTSMADLNLVSRMVRIPGVKQMKPEIRYARDMTIGDAKEKNLVLIGGPRANPWVELFANHMNFYVDFDWKQHRNSVINKHPLSGEEPLYIENAVASSTSVFGLIAFQPSLDGEGNALLVAGTSSPGTQTAGDFLFNSHAFKDFLWHVRRQDGSIPHFEVLLQAKSIRGNPPQSTIIGSRIDP